LIDSIYSASQLQWSQQGVLMGAAYSQDLRDRVLMCYDRGMSTRQIADVLSVSPAWARRVKQQRRETGQTSAKPLGGARRIKIDPNRLVELVQAYPDATLKELRQRLGIACAESAICMALQRLKLSFKKRRFTPPNRIARTWRSGEASGVISSPNATSAS
jgi:transposase